MRIKKIIPILASLILLLTGCTSESTLKQESSNNQVPTYNLYLIVDGTDIISNEHYSVPKVTSIDIVRLVHKVRSVGKGKVFLTFIDDNSENNAIAYLSIPQIPITEEKKPKMDFEARDIYNSRKEKARAIFNKDNYEFTKNLDTFVQKSEEILADAYSTRVAKIVSGSDIFGAINTANGILKSISNNTTSQNYILLISDAADNVWKPLFEMPTNVTLLSITNSNSDNMFGDRAKELPNLDLIEEKIFENQ